MELRPVPMYTFLQKLCQAKLPIFEPSNRVQQSRRSLNMFTPAHTCIDLTIQNSLIGQTKIFNNADLTISACWHHCHCRLLRLPRLAGPSTTKCAATEPSSRKAYTTPIDAEIIQTPWSMVLVLDRSCISPPKSVFFKFGACSFGRQQHQKSALHAAYSSCSFHPPFHNQPICANFFLDSCSLQQPIRQ